MRFLVNVTTRAISIPVGEVDKAYHTKTVTFKPRKPMQLDEELETEILKNGKTAFDAGDIVEITDEKATELLEEWERMKTMRNVHFRDHSDPFLATAARFAREERNQDEMAVFQPIKHYIL
jgi:hypothetical protein